MEEPLEMAHTMLVCNFLLLSFTVLFIKDGPTKFCALSNVYIVLSSVQLELVRIVLVAYVSWIQITHETLEDFLFHFQSLENIVVRARTLM